MKNILILTLCLSFFPIFALERSTSILTGDTYTREHWTCSDANTTGTSQSCPSGYSSYYSAGDYIGVPYKWGGFDSIEQFREKISQGYGAGSYSSDGVLDCVTGIDCSGYVSRCWGETSKYGTSTIQEISTELESTDEMKKADAFNDAGSHIVMLAYYHRDGSPVIMEAAGGSYRKAVFRKASWSYLNGYVPEKYNEIEDDKNVEGTILNPIKIESFPYQDSGNTRNMNSLEIDSYSAAPETSETGPEVIYRFTINTSGTIDIAVTDIQSEYIDNDIQLLSNLDLDTDKMAVNTIARDDHSITQHLAAGTYFIVVDSFSSSGTDEPGEYTMTAGFESDVMGSDEDNEFSDEQTEANQITDESEDTDIFQEKYDESVNVTNDGTLSDDDTSSVTDENFQTSNHNDDETETENSGCSVVAI